MFDKSARSAFFDIRQYGPTQEALVLVRPDGHIGLTTGSLSPQPIIDYLHDVTRGALENTQPAQSSAQAEGVPQAKERMGITGSVHGIDPSRQMIAYARSKIPGRKLSVDLQIGAVEHLTFPERSFYVVLCTWMIHHLPTDDQKRGLAEMARVLKPGGHLLLVDSHLDELPLPYEEFSRLDAGDIPFGKSFGFLLVRKNLTRAATNITS